MARRSTIAGAALLLAWAAVPLTALAAAPRVGLVGTSKPCRTAIRELIEADAKVVERDKVPGRPSSTDPDALERWINASVRPGSVDLVLVVDAVDRGTMRVLAFRDGTMVGLRLIETGKSCTIAGREGALTRAWLHSRLHGTSSPVPAGAVAGAATPAGTGAGPESSAAGTASAPGAGAPPSVPAAAPPRPRDEPADPDDIALPAAPSASPLPGASPPPAPAATPPTSAVAPVVPPPAAAGRGRASSEPRDPDDATPPRSAWPVPRDFDDPMRPRRPGFDPDAPAPRRRAAEGSDATDAADTATVATRDLAAPRRSWLRLTASLDLVSHTFEWVEPVTPDTRELRFDLVPTPRLAAELVPLVGVGPDWLDPTTFFARYRRTFGLVATRSEGGPEHALTFADFELGVAYPLTFSVEGRAVTLRPQLSVRDVRVVLDLADDGADEVELPDVTYTALAPGLLLDVVVQGRVHVAARAAYQLVLGLGGPLGDLPGASRHGFALGAGVSFDVSAVAAIDVGLDWLRYSVRFDDADAATARARGADDETLTVSAAFTYRL